MQDSLRHIPVVIRYGQPKAFAGGGLASAAEDVSEAGRHGDDMLIHVNKEEFEALREAWGEPTINPQTGMPEYFSLKKLWKKAKKFAGPVAGAAANYFLPGIGSTVGNALGVGANLGSAIASGAIGAGVGALADGKEGALYGGLAGAASPYLFGSDGIGGNAGLVGNLFSSGLGALTGAGTGTGAGAAPGAAATGANGMLNGSLKKVAQYGAGTGGGGLGALLSNPKAAVALASAAASLYGDSQKDDKAAKEAAKRDREAQDAFNAPLPQYQLARTYVGPSTQVPDYTQQGEQEYYENNALTAASGGYIRLARGGMPKRQRGDRAVSGPGSGRDDLIPARLSDGEYVVDAETTALIGDGSSEEGARRLDQMREAVRAHKGQALAQGQISPDALHPLQYLQGMK